MKRVILMLFLLSSCMPKTPTMEEIKEQVALDQEAQFRLSKQGGDQTEICVKAQFVAEAYNQAQDSANYLKWKSIQECECAKSKNQNSESFQKMECN